MMPILIKGDDTGTGTKGQCSSQLVMGGMGVNGLRKR